MKVDPDNRKNEIWKEVEILIHGPYEAPDGNGKAIVTLRDKYSNFMLGEVVRYTARDQLSVLVAKYVFSSLCTFGIAKCFFTSESVPLFESFMKIISNMFSSLNGISCKPEHLFEFVNRDDGDESSTAQDIEYFVKSTIDWESKFDAWLFNCRTWADSDSEAPFAVMFNGRQPFSKTMSRASLKRQRQFVCTYCAQSFESRIRFELHVKIHSEESREPSQELTSTLESPRNEKLQQTNGKMDAQEVKESTLSAVKALLVATKDERTKRGKYFKYTLQQKEEIVRYAQEHGNRKAANHFSLKYGNPLAESTVRNFARTINIIIPDSLKIEIGKLASESSVAHCIAAYEDRMELTEKFVKQCVSTYLSSQVVVEDKKERRFFDPSLRNEIGRYAYHCGTAKAVLHFSEKLQFQVNDSTVRKYKRIWMEQNGADQDVHNPKGIIREALDVSSGKKEESKVLFRGKESSGVETGDDFVQESSCTSDNNQPMQLTVEASRATAKPTQTRKLISSCSSLRGRKKRKALKRGHYANYDPALRAEVAKFASTHSNQDTILHFFKKIGIQLPESTVRSLRKRYEQQNSTKEMHQLDRTQRGRPMHLGKYDTMVRECIRQLVESSGEKVSSFMAIATAKQVLMENEPELLHENGGPINLNPNWAKSFIRRMGLGKKN